MRVLTVLDVLCKDHQGSFPMRGRDQHDGVDDGLTETDVTVLFQAVGKELQQDGGLGRDSLIQETCRRDDLDFEVDSQVRQVVSDLLEQLLDAVLIASLQQGRDGKRCHRPVSVSDQALQLGLANPHDFRLTRGDLVHHTKGCILVDRLRALRCKHSQHLEGCFNLNDRAVDLIQLT